MRNLDTVVGKIEERINAVDEIREKSIKESREIIMDCRRGIQLLHRERDDEARRYINNASRKLKALYKLISRHPEIMNAGFVDNAGQEVAEARSILDLKRYGKLPDPDVIEVPASIFLMGMCDAVGEMRRFALDALRENRLDEADRYLEMMENIYESIMRFDYPSSFVPIKKKQDMIRSLIEKTRSELAVASSERRIQDKIEEFRELFRDVEKVDKRKKKEKKKKKDLDIDKIW